MSVLRPLLSRRGRLVFAATALLLVGALLAVPSVSGARAAVKQFTATIDPTTATGGVPSHWTVQVTNCGFPVVSPCTASSTIGLGSIRIAVPTQFQSATASITSQPAGKNWTVTATPDPATGNLTAVAVTGSDKLGPGQSVSIGIDATPATTACGPGTFTTAAWGSASVPGTDPFEIKTSQPTVTVANPGCLESGGSVTGPGGQIETITGDFQGHVSVTFGGDDVNCSFDEQFGSQWSQFNLPAQVGILPAGDFVPGNGPKISTSRFPTEGFDSSLYLICFASPTTFATRGGTPPQVVTIGGTNFFVGILPNCYDPVSGLTRPEPCVSEQFLDVSTTPDQIVISIRMRPGDPYKR